MIAVADAPPAGSTVENRVAELQKTVSASRLSLWLQCRLKFYYRYMVRIQKPPTPAMHSGSTIHAVLQQWNLARWRREPFKIEGYKTIFESLWKTMQAGVKILWDDEEESERSSSWRALEHYFTETPVKADERPEGVEVRVEADLSRHGLPTLIGIIDLVRREGKIVDFKVVGKTPDIAHVAHQHEIQLSCYSILYRDATDKEAAGLELHHLVKTKTPKFILTPLPPMTGNQQIRLFRQIASYQEGLVRQDFVPSPGFPCAACEYFHECRQWCG